MSNIEHRPFISREEGAKLRQEKREAGKKTFTLFWRTGQSQLVLGTNCAEAMTLAGYSNGAVRALDFYANGDERNNYQWNSQNKKWDKVKKATYQSKKTATSYIVTYRGQTKEFPFMGYSLSAWKEAEIWMNELDNCKKVQVDINRLTISSVEFPGINVATGNKETYAQRIALALNTFEKRQEYLQYLACLDEKLEKDTFESLKTELQWIAKEARELLKQK